MFNKLVLAAAVLASASVAQAATFTSAFGAPDPGPGAGFTLIDNFNNASSQPAGVTITGGYAFRAFTANDAAAPAGDTTQYLYVSSALNPNNATINFANQRAVSFYWGSIDTYNKVDVLGVGGTSILTVTGSQIQPANGDRASGNTNQRVTFRAGTNETITGLRLTSTGVAFEIDDLFGIAGSGSGSTVPEPSSWAMLIAGFGLVGFASRRRGSARITA